MKTDVLSGSTSGPRPHREPHKVRWLLVVLMAAGCGSVTTQDMDADPGGSDKALGATCALGSECASGHCVDTVCCEAACAGACQACGASGACEAIADGEDPDGECLNDAVCDGSGSCVCRACTGTETCQTLGFACGVAVCNAIDCLLDTSGCGTADMPWQGWDTAHGELQGDSITTFNVDADTIMTGTAATNGGANTTGVRIDVGDWLFLGGPEKREDVGGITFDLRVIPAGAEIVSATIRVYQESVTGSAYVSPMEQVVVDHVRFDDIWGADEAPAITASLATPAVLSTNATAGIKTADVTAAVRYDLASCQTRSQFRLIFAPANTIANTTDNQAYFTSDDATANRPTLVVRYRP